jgi:hypothetical protein
MKVIVNIIKFILIIMLTVSIIGVVSIKVLSSTVLDEAYILNLLNRSNYYENIYNEIESNFEKYIAQSGLDEDVINNVCTVEDVKNDTKLILGNIYEGTDKKVDASAIKQRLADNINASLEGEKISNSTQEAIDKFIETVGNEYTSTISHTDYENEMYNYYQKMDSKIGKVEKSLYITIIILIVLLLAVCIKKIYTVISWAGIGVTASGAFLVISNYIFNANVKVQQLKILNDSASVVLQNGIADILAQVTKTGWVLAVIGLVVVILGSIVKTIKTED